MPLPVTNPEFTTAFESLQKDFNNITTSYTDTITGITENIKFDSRDTDELKDRLIQFALEQDKIANSSSLAEGLLRRVEKLPWLGGIAKESADSIRSTRLNEESVSGLVGTMYTGLKKQADTIKEAEQTLIGILETTEENIINMIKLCENVDNMISEGNIPRREYSQTLHMATHTKTMLENSRNKIETLNLVIPTMRGCLVSIRRELPISQAELTSDLAISAGVSQLNNLVTDLKDLNHLSSVVAVNIHTKTQTSLKSMIELNTVTEEDILKLEDNAKRRDKLYQETMVASQESNKQLQIAHVRITDLAKSSQAKREQNQLLLQG